jgi:hypothetical protein
VKGVYEPYLHTYKPNVFNFRIVASKQIDCMEGSASSGYIPETETNDSHQSFILSQ